MRGLWGLGLGAVSGFVLSEASLRLFEDKSEKLVVTQACRSNEVSGFQLLQSVMGSFPRLRLRSFFFSLSCVLHDINNAHRDNVPSQLFRQNQCRPCPFSCPATRTSLWKSYSTCAAYFHCQLLEKTDCQWAPEKLKALRLPSSLLPGLVFLLVLLLSICRFASSSVRKRTA